MGGGERQGETEVGEGSQDHTEAPLNLPPSSRRQTQALPASWGSSYTDPGASPTDSIFAWHHSDDWDAVGQEAH